MLSVYIYGRVILFRAIVYNIQYNALHGNVDEFWLLLACIALAVGAREVSDILVRYLFVHAFVCMTWLSSRYLNVMCGCSLGL